MKQFINEIRTGKRHINKKIINAFTKLNAFMIMLFMFALMLEIIGIDLLGFYK